VEIMMETSSHRPGYFFPFFGCFIILIFLTIGIIIL
jgi:hypothetical protein